ncbi:MAG: hypothetical protein U5K51_16845 [Flavobacteriaceae bacterium]|nr:hypothetical protein [Flavobacteriaceae bacterium]
MINLVSKSVNDKEMGLSGTIEWLDETTTAVLPAEAHWFKEENLSTLNSTVPTGITAIMKTATEQKFPPRSPQLTIRSNWAITRQKISECG